MSTEREIALVTGASSGIGMEIARILASQNCDLVICARRKKELDDLSKELTKKYNINCKVIVADLTTDKGINNLIKKTKNPKPVVTKKIRRIKRPLEASAAKE